MAEHFNKPGPDKSSAGEHEKMNRSKALMTIGAFAAGLPFIQSVITNLTSQVTGNNQVSGKIPDDPVLVKAISELEYLTPADKFLVQRRGQPVLSEIPADKLAAIGLTQETWKLEILPDPENNSEIGNPLTREKGNAIGWPDLIKLPIHVPYDSFTCSPAPTPPDLTAWAYGKVSLYANSYG